MKVAVFHFSDIHLTGKKDFVVSRLKYISKAAHTVIDECQKIIIVISGDIANTGSKNEYDVALQFFHDLELQLVDGNSIDKNIVYIIVPGNHDCDLSKDTVRDAVIANAIKQVDSIPDQSRDYLFKCQSNYWEFYKNITKSTDSPFIGKEIRIPLSTDFSFVFHCYNTSLLSTLHERVGGLIIPESEFVPPYQGKEKSLVISVFHHNTGWLDPSGNNKKQFEKHIFNTSNIVFCGHEHESKELLESSLSKDDELVYLEGNAFQNNRNSEFSINVIDTNSLCMEHHTFKYNDSELEYLRMYNNISTDSINIKQKTRGLSIKKEFEDSLLKLKIPIVHFRGRNLKLNDCYVFQDLEPILEGNLDYGQYRDAETLASEKNLDYKIAIIEGEAQSGKSSLLRMLLLRFIKRGIYPLLINGNDINPKKIDDLLEKTYKNLYNSNVFPYECYRQLDKKDKVILIDNINRSRLNETGLSSLYSHILTYYGAIIVTADQKIDLTSLLTSADSTKDTLRFKLLSLGSVKRNIIIEKWFNLDSDPNTINIQEVEQKTKEYFDIVGNILGEQFLSPYPFYIISILQTITKVSFQDFNIHESYYAYCYKSLLIASLRTLGIDAEKQKDLLAFMSFIAIEMYNKKKDKPRLTEEEFTKVFSDYKNSYVFSYTNKDSCIKDLIDSNILEFHENRYRFTSKYIYYYLAAEKLAEKINTPEINNEVTDLCSSLHKEESANILIFLVHHTKDKNLIETLRLAGMYTFDKYEPITLQTNDPIVSGIFNLIEKVRTKFLIQDINPRDERQKVLSKQEKIERRKEKESTEYNDIEEIGNDPDLKNVVIALRTVKILGQIVKNERSGIEKNTIIDLIEDSYKTSFRLISFFADEIEKSINDIVEHLKKKALDSKKIDETKIREDAGKLLGYLLYNFCLNIFSNLTHSVGAKNFNQIYDLVAKKIGTPAAKLVSFTIQSYYGPMDISSLEELFNEFNSNPVAQQILRARAIHYVYHNTVSSNDKRRIGQICKLKLIDVADINKNKR